MKQNHILVTPCFILCQIKCANEILLLHISIIDDFAGKIRDKMKLILSCHRSLFLTFQLEDYFVWATFVAFSCGNQSNGLSTVIAFNVLYTGLAGLYG